MDLNKCMDNVTSQSVLKKFATGLVENRKEKDILREIAQIKDMVCSLNEGDVV